MTKTMTINELISKLKEYDGESAVKVRSDGANKAYPISHVFIGSINKEDLVYINIGDRINEKAPVYINIDDSNLVDLSKVWHDASEEPTTESTRVLATDEKGFIDVFSLEKGKFKISNGCIPWSSIVVCFNLTKWAYVSDLLPKGGEK